MLAISEIPPLWGRSLQKWRTANRRFKKQIDDAEAPDADEEYLLYQTLLGTWPVDLDGAPVSSVGPKFIARIQRYMAKALKEAKLNTSWIQPNENWDDAMQEFVARILEAGPRNKFLPAFLPVAAEIARLGAINSLAQTVIKLTAPGVPDIYQGTEIWDDSLVDPDNRRPIDYARRREMLTQIEKLPRERIDAMLAGRANQNAPNAATTAFASRKSGVISRRNLRADQFRRRLCRLRDRFCSARQRPGDHCDRAALVVARRFSADWRSVAGHPCGPASSVCLICGMSSAIARFASRIRS